MSDSVILLSMKKSGEDNHGFESDRSCKWPFSLTVSCTKRGEKKVEQASEGLRRREKSMAISRTVTGWSSNIL